MLFDVNLCQTFNIKNSLNIVLKYVFEKKYFKINEFVSEIKKKKSKLFHVDVL